MEISNEMMLALHALRSESVSDSKLAEKLDVSRSTLSKIFSGELRDVRRATWEKIASVARPRLEHAGCAQGYASCPLAGAPEFKALVKLLVEADDAVLYDKLSREVLEWQESNKKSTLLAR